MSFEALHPVASLGPCFPLGFLFVLTISNVLSLAVPIDEARMLWPKSASFYQVLSDLVPSCNSCKINVNQRALEMESKAVWCLEKTIMSLARRPLPLFWRHDSLPLPRQSQIMTPCFPPHPTRAHLQFGAFRHPSRVVPPGIRILWSEYLQWSFLGPWVKISRVSFLEPNCKSGPSQSRCPDWLITM